jgi:hypothetical protein
MWQQQWDLAAVAVTVPVATLRADAHSSGMGHGWAMSLTKDINKKRRISKVNKNTDLLCILLVVCTDRG